MRITALLGAGATFEIGAPTTNELTQKVCNKKQIFLGSTSNTIRSVARILSRYYAPDNINFEHLLHVLEMLDTYKYGWEKARNVRFKPPITPFIKPRYHKFLKDHLKVQIAKSDLIDTIAKEVHKYDQKFRSAADYNWYKTFWRGSGKLWDLATLNYDTTLENSLMDYEDGFEDTGHNYYRFNPLKLSQTNKSRIMHLHGCIEYGYPRNIHNEYVYEDTWEDVYKLKHYEEARQTWNGRSTNRTQASEETIIGPIITGLRKMEKLNTYPYSFYNYQFQNSIVQNKSLIVVGYGFGDLYLNQIMERMNRIHGKAKRVVIITYYDKQYWADDHRIIGFPETNDAYLFFAKAFSDQNPFKGYTYSSFERKEPIRSKNGDALIFLRGFKEAVTNHQKEILDFLS